MLNISCLKGDSDQTKFRFGISVKNCIGCDSFGKNPRNFIFHRKIYRKSGYCLSKIRKFWANSAHLRTWPRYWCDSAVWKIWGLWGHYFWSYRVNGRPDILTDFRVYSSFFLSTQKRMVILNNSSTEGDRDLILFLLERGNSDASICIKPDRSMYWPIRWSFTC